MKTKPFNLEAAKAGAKLITRDFRPARIICWDAQRNARHGNQPIVALVMSDDKQETPYAYYTDGSFMSVGGKSYADLFLVDETPESELTEFEKVVADWMEMAKDEPITNEMIVDAADNLMFIARKELQKEQKPAEWSEEDLQHKSWILECLADGEKKMQEYAEDFRAAYKWLKCLHSSCKPSEEQMKSLKRAVNKLAKSDIEDSVMLSIMYDNLKKL